MRLISWNVANRVEKQPSQLEAVLLRQPDLLALQEITKKTGDLWREGLSQAGYREILFSLEQSSEPEK